ncbi:MAG TPA: hypothetical protein VMY42_26435 [Thermoguttaceae bacterium]|nr:hypothetical protein [Thermoguttaceae bacterium]
MASATAVEEIRGFRPTQDCPACDGIMPIDAITYGPWQMVHGAVRSYYRRRVSMRCPHCGAIRTRIQRANIPGVA